MEQNTNGITNDQYSSVSRNRNNTMLGAVPSSSDAFNMDCVEGMNHYPDKYFDLAICDPPYGIDVANMRMGIGKGKRCSKEKNRNWTAKDWDKETPNEIYFDELLML